MTTPHKHAELIKAWADGAQIQVKYETAPEWKDITYPKWTEGLEYRVKPESKPDFEKLMYFYADLYHSPDLCVVRSHLGGTEKNVRFVFDGNTGDLKSVTFIGNDVKQGLI